MGVDINRAHVGKQIIEIVNKYHATVFGGYIRDLIAGEEFNDIDILISNGYNSANVSLIMNEISKLYYIEDLGVGNYYNGFARNRVKVHYESSNNINGIMNLDFISVFNGDMMSNLPFHNDVSVNSLFKDTRGEISVLGGYWKVEYIIDQIHNREYECYGKVMERRIKKIEDKGYRQKNKNIQQDIACKQCGKNVFRNDMECWWCMCKSPGK